MWNYSSLDMKNCAPSKEERHWATKVTEFFFMGMRSELFSAQKNYRANYNKVTQAILVCFNYKQERNMKCLMEYAPLKKPIPIVCVKFAKVFQIIG